MKKVALITGASSGIGLELAKIMGRGGHNLVLVARRAEKLENLKKDIEQDNSVSVFTIAQDLTEEGAISKINDLLVSQNLEVDVLVNNAGFGSSGLFVDADIKKEKQMIKLNVLALTELTNLIARQMVSRGEGKIMNVASVAAFFPGPLMSVYYATKAYVLSFSEALCAELKPTGVTVTTLCPGVTKSEFQKVAYNMPVEKMYGKGFQTSEEVAQYGYDAMINGCGTVVPGFKNKVYVFLSRFLPNYKAAEIIFKKHGGR